jgi:hypothetical protein
MPVLLSSRPLLVSEYFGPVNLTANRDFVIEAEVIERGARIEDHPFFVVAGKSREALVVWASQEAVVTNPFSQVLFEVMAAIKNVHVRSILLPVVAGEHSNLRNGIAERSHPWLIWQLCRSLGVNEKEIKPTRAVIEFIDVLESTVNDPMLALGALGIGNELMLLAEYRAIERCFESACPEADYRDFLHANIGEDETHTKLIGTAAAALADLGFNARQFVVGAQIGVAARVKYYDSLLSEISSEQEAQRANG